MSTPPTSPKEFAFTLGGASEELFDEPVEVDALVIEDGNGDDPALALRRVLGMFATGVTIVTTRVSDDVHGMTANAFMSVSLEPPLVLISVDRRTKMCDLLHEGRRFGVSILAAGQEALSDRFAGRPTAHDVEPRFDLVNGTPLVDEALAHFIAVVTRSYWGGDHSLFLGRVEYACTNAGAPLLFHGGRYERLGRAAPAG